MRIPLRLPVAFLVALCALIGAAVAWGAPAPVRVVSQTVGTDELLLALAAPDQIAALSHLARNPVFSTTAEQAEALIQADMKRSFKSDIPQRLVQICGTDTTKMAAVVDALGSTCVRYVKP